MRVRIIITILLLLSHAYTINGSDNTFLFRNINADDGLSENHINCVFQDKTGFIWIGTNSGLNRYDGYEFKIFSFDPISRSGLKSNIIHCITEDQEGNLWIGTADQGVCKLNLETESFTYFENTDEAPDRFLSISVYDALTDSADRIWFRSNRGIEIFIPSNETDLVHTIQFPVNDVNTTRELNHYPTRIYSDELDRMWIGTENGLYLAFEDSLIKNVFYLEYLPEITNDKIFDIAHFGNDLFLALSDRVIRARIGRDGSAISIENICYEYFRTICLDKSGNLWGALTDGLQYYKYNPEEDKYLYTNTFRSDITNPRSISENNIIIIEKDKTGLLWIGTYMGGLSILDPDGNPFNHHFNLAGVHSSAANRIRCFLEDSYKNMWIGAGGGNIFLIPDVPQRSYSDNIIHKTMRTGEAGGNQVYSLAEGTFNKKPVVWIGAQNPLRLGISPLSPDMSKDFKIKQIKNFPAAAFDILVDSENIVWICTYFSGLYRLFPDEKGLGYWENITSNQDGSGLSSNIARSVFEDNEGNIWVGTSNGLDCIRKSEKRKNEPEIINYRNEPDNPNSLSHDYIVPIMQGKDGALWIGTLGGGVNKMVKNQAGGYNFTRITTKDGLPDNMIKGLLEDDDGNIWISSNKGISKYNARYGEDHYFIETGLVNNFDKNDGLQDMHFSDLSCVKTRAGEMFFGGINGFNSFYPDRIKNTQEDATPVLTELYILNKVVGINEKLNGRIVLDKSISALKGISLKHKENSFSIRFSAINFNSPEKTNFKFRLEGFDDEWISRSGPNRAARYTNLKSGHYKFILRTSDNSTTSIQEPLILDIHIKPPYWKSAVAIVIYSLVIILSIVFFRKFTLISIRRKNDLLLEEIEKEHLEELTQTKLRLFTNLSHEIRTPLTLIHGPVKNLIQDFKTLSDEKKLKLFNSIEKNANKINYLINQLLDFRKAESGKIRLAVRRSDIITITRSILDDFLEWAEEKNIDLRFYIEQQQPLSGWIDPDIYEKILNNLINNAIKYTPRNGKIKVTIIAENPGMLTVEVEDNGPGIPENEIESIFERFWIADQNQQSGSTGIGLSFVNTLVNLHHGQISCTSKINHGTTFKLSIPTVKTSFTEDEISQKTVSEPVILPKKIYGPAGSTQPETHHISRGKELKLLVIDDNSEILEFIADNLGSGFILSFAKDGQEGLKQAARKMPDIIVCDIMMPVMDGIEFCSKLKNHPDLCHIPVLMLTAKAEDKDRIMGFSTGADAYILKPFDIDVLKSNIDAIYKTRQILRNKFARQIEINPGEVTVNDQDEMLLQLLIKLLEENISDPKYKASDLAREAGKSVTQLNLKIKAISGLTTGSFMKATRLKRAAQLIEKSDYTISEITFKVGFSDVKYFRNCFKKEFGRSPSQYRDEILKNQENQTEPVRDSQ